MHLARLANTPLKDGESARDNHVLACNFEDPAVLTNFSCDCKASTQRLRIVILEHFSRWFITLHQRAPQSKVIESVGGVLHRAPAACVSEGRQAAAETTSYYVSKG